MYPSVRLRNWSHDEFKGKKSLHCYLDRKEKHQHFLNIPEWQGVCVLIIWQERELDHFSNNEHQQAACLLSRKWSEFLWFVSFTTQALQGKVSPSLDVCWLENNIAEYFRFLGIFQLNTV